MENNDFDINFDDSFIAYIFLNYQRRKKEKRLYSSDDYIPQNIIKSYYALNDNPRFEFLLTNFRRRYLYNENVIEDVHEIHERKGLRVVYEYVHGDKNPKDINIYEILKIHQLLYSKSPHPEFGGSFRNHPIFLPNSGVETEDWSYIPQKMASLYPVVKDIIELGVEIKQNNDVKRILSFVDKCVELNCELIKIHPFSDGNGRTMRAFTNMLFKVAKVPPIYIKVSEREEYGKAMNLALTENDLSHIKRFYYYKICDSIYELDIKPKLEMKFFKEKKDSFNTKKKKN